ncbi:MAG: hypothetical protein Q9199_001162 [Rusavskia elegans]
MSNSIEAGLVSEAKEVFLQGLLRSDSVKQLQEGEMGSIVLKEENPEVIAKLVDYFYKFDYDDGNDDNRQQPDAQSSAPTKLAFNALMYAAGDKYDIGGLQLLAKAKFSAALVEGWNKEDLPEVIRFIYENTVSSDRGLRECLVPTLIQHKQASRSDDAFRKVVGTVGEFAVDLIDAWTDPNQGSPTGLPGQWSSLSLFSASIESLIHDALKQVAKLKRLNISSQNRQPHLTQWDRIVQKDKHQ